MLMAVNNPRNKAIIFRVTQGEYETLRRAFKEDGARSLSDFARAKLIHSIENPASGFTDLHARLERIEQLLEKS
jgi:hypothetical protein